PAVGAAAALARPLPAPLRPAALGAKAVSEQRPGVELRWPLTRLRAHEQAAAVPPLSSDEYASLRADIAAHGVLVPLEATADGVLLDGHHRLQAALELGLQTVPVRIAEPQDELAYMLP